MDGVVRTTVGYAGGTTPDPTYQRIGDHTETIEIEFDPTLVGYEDLLEVFWDSHDPLRPAWSRQYRSAIFFSDEEQLRLAEQSRARIAARRSRDVVTAIEPAGAFTRAEDYHQKYRLRGDRALMPEFAAMYPNPREFADSTAAARVNGFVGGDGETAVLDKVADRLGLSDAAVERLWKTVQGNQVGELRRIFRCS